MTCLLVGRLHFTIALRWRKANLLCLSARRNVWVLTLKLKKLLPTGVHLSMTLKNKTESDDDDGKIENST